MGYPTLRPEKRVANGEGYTDGGGGGDSKADAVPAGPAKKKQKNYLVFQGGVVRNPHMVETGNN